MDRCHRLGQRKHTLPFSAHCRSLKTIDSGEDLRRDFASPLKLTLSSSLYIDRPIKVTRLVIENSIESRILELQKKKENLAASALGDDDKAMGRLSPEDLAFLFSL